jgi:beta-galactosidase GanA
MGAGLPEGLFFYGTQFYRPPNPPEGQRVRDLENVKKLGFNVIKIFAEWNWINHHEDLYDFEELLRIVEQAKKLDIAIVVNTRLEQVPYWLVEKYPDALYVNARGRAIPIQTRANTPTGGWPGVCFDHPGARQEAEKFYARIAETFGKHENVRIFDCWNEPHIEPVEHSDSTTVGEFLFCYCHNTVARYREWLKRRYGSIETLNEKWFRRYRDFSDIDPPPRLMDYVDMTEWRKFMSWSMGEHMSFRYRALKSRLPADKLVMSHTVMHGATVGFSLYGADDYQLSKDLDLFGLSLFPLWGNQDAYDVACDLGITRSMARGKTCINLELQGGPSASSPTGLTRSKAPRPNHYRVWNWSDLAFGIKGIMYWHYRAEMLGREAPGFGLVNRDGGFTDRSEEVSRLCGFLNRHAALFNHGELPANEVAILVNRDSYYLNFASEGQETYSVISARGAHRFFLRHGLEPDFLIEEMLEERLSHYRLAYLLLPLVMDERTAGALKRYVQGGGVLISDCGVGSFDSYGVASEVIPSCGLDELFGARQEDFRQFDFQNREEIYSEFFTILPDSVGAAQPPVYLQGLDFLRLHRVKMTTFMESYLLEGAEPLLEHEGRIVGAVHHYGKGRAYLLGTAAAQSLYLRDRDTQGALLAILEHAGIRWAYREGLILREMRHQDQKGLIVINPEKGRVRHSVPVQSSVRVIESYGPGLRVEPQKGSLRIEIDPEDAGCIVYAER